MLELADLRAAGELPLVTVMVANYNYERFLGRALDSALAQDYPADRIEIVVVDDGSTDGSAQLLERYRAEHPDRIQVIHQANAGNKAAANAALAASRGQLLAMLDADDTWPPEKTRRQVDRMLEDPTLGLVYCDQTIIDAEGRVLRPSRFRWLDYVAQRGASAFPAIMGFAGNIAVNSTLMFRRELAERIFPIPLRMTFQDWWIVGWAAALSPIDCVDGTRIGYRVHGANGVFGRTGSGRLRGTCRAVEARRQMLVHGGGDHLDTSDLLMAWRAWEQAALFAVQITSSVYLPLIAATPEERAQGAQCAGAAQAAYANGDCTGTLRALVRALACDPDNGELRERVRDLAWALETIERAAPADEHTRRLVTLGGLDELLAEPSLLADYAAAAHGDDDATLAVIADGVAGQQLLTLLEEAVARAGLSLDELPDVVVASREDAAGRAILDASVCALTDRPWEWDQRPCFRAGGYRALVDLGLLGRAPAEALAAVS